MEQHHQYHHSSSADPRQGVSAHYPRQYPQPVVHSSVGPQSSYRHTAPHRPQIREHHGRQKKVLMAGGGMLALATLVVSPSINQADDAIKTGGADLCIKQVDRQSLVSRDELKALLDLDKNVSKARVQEIVNQPHCVLQSRAAENGVQVEREAYPLEFDPQTWFVLQYQEGNFTGFDFSFR